MNFLFWITLIDLRLRSFLGPLPSSAELQSQRDIPRYKAINQQITIHPRASNSAPQQYCDVESPTHPTNQPKPSTSKPTRDTASNMPCASPSSSNLISAPPSPLPTPSLTSPSLRNSYTISRGEIGVLTFEPYKSLLLPYWRFRTVSIARSSAEALWAIFVSYGERGDFVGMDMARKFVRKFSIYLASSFRSPSLKRSCGVGCILRSEMAC